MNTINLDIKYILDGGENNPDNPTSFNLAKDNIILKNPEKLGHTFLGWYNNPEFEDDPISQFNPQEINIEEEDLANYLLDPKKANSYFLWQIFDNMGIPYNTEVKFNGYIQLNKKIYHLGTVKLEPKISASDSTGNIHFKFNEYFKFHKDISNRIIRPSDRYSIPFNYQKGEMYGISFYPLDENNNFLYPGYIEYNSSIMQKQRINELINNKIITSKYVSFSDESVANFIPKRQTIIYDESEDVFVILSFNQEYYAVNFMNTISQEIIYSYTSPSYRPIKEILLWKEAEVFILVFNNDIVFLDSKTYSKKYTDISVDRDSEITQVVQKSPNQVLVKYKDFSDLYSLQLENSIIEATIIQNVLHFTDYFEDKSFFVDYTSGATVIREFSYVDPRNIVIYDKITNVYNIIHTIINRFETLIISTDIGVGIVVLRKTNLIKPIDPNDPEDPEDEEEEEEDEELSWQDLLDAVWGPDDEDGLEEIDPEDNGLEVTDPQFELLITDPNYTSNSHLKIVQRKNELIGFVSPNNKYNSMQQDSHNYESLINNFLIKISPVYTPGEEIATGWTTRHALAPYPGFQSIHLHYPDIKKDTVIHDFFIDSKDTVYIFSQNINLEYGDLFSYREGLVNVQDGGYIEAESFDGMIKSIQVEKFFGTVSINPEDLRHPPQEFEFPNPDYED